MEELTGSYQQ
jgi:hypothetical protein